MGHRHPFRNRILLAACLLALAGVAWGPVRAAVPCTATVDGSADSDQVWQEFVDKQFNVRISTDADCGMVYVDLVATEQLFNGELITTTNRSGRKATGSANTTYRFSYRMAKDSTLVKWEFKVGRCVVCGTE